MKLTTIFVVVILIVIILVTFQFINGGNVSEGLSGRRFDPQFEWDYEYMKAKNKELGFTVDTWTSNQDVNFRNSLIDMGWTYSLVSAGAPQNPEFPSIDKGVCMSDWYSVTDPKTRLTAARDIRFAATGSPGYIWYPAKHPDAYEKCKKLATDSKANVFGLEYGGQCFYGDTNYLIFNPDGTAHNGDNRKDTLKVLPKENCNRPGFPDGNGSGWTTMIWAKPVEQKKYRFDYYEKNIRDWVNKPSPINTSTKMLKSYRVNRGQSVDGMTVREGMIEGATGNVPEIPIDITGKPISWDELAKITSTKAEYWQPSINANIIWILEYHKYKVPKEQYDKFIDKMKSINIWVYVWIMKWFGIQSEDTENEMVNQLRNLNAHKDAFTNEALLIWWLMYYQVNNVNAVLENPLKPNTNWFAMAIKNNGLDKLPFPTLPSTAFGNDWGNCLIFKLWFQLGVMAPNIDDFFGTFSAYSTSASDFFANIFPILTGAKFGYWYRGKEDLDNILNYVQSSAPSKSLSDAFKDFNDILVSLELTFKGYMSFMQQLKDKVGTPSNIKELIADFKTYYTTVAHSDDKQFNVKPKVTAHMIFTDFFDLIPDYFHPGQDFGKFLKTCISHNYTINSINRDKALGTTYSHFMSGSNKSSEHPTEQFISSFTEFENPSSDTLFGNLARVYNDIIRTGKTMLGYKEGVDATLSGQPDHLALSNFGITDFGAQLGQLEQLLLSNSYGFSSWNEVMEFIDPVSKLIQYEQLPEYVNTMVKFGARTRVEWNDISTKFAALHINSYTDIKAFLNIIIPFGVNYNNFPDFTQTLKDFKADLVQSSPSLPKNALKTFCADMTTIGFTYGSNAQTVKNIVSYFLLAGYTLQTYPKIPSLTVNAIYSYGRSTKYNNQLYDIIQKPPLTSVLPAEFDKKNIITQAYLVASNQKSYNPNTKNEIAVNSVILDDVDVYNFISLLYSEEFEALKKDTAGTAYSDVSIRLKIMSDISTAAMNISKEYLNSNASLNSFYEKLSYLVQIAPMLMFAFLYQQVQAKTLQNNIDYLVDPHYSYCKATTTTITSNYRKLGPVIP